MRYYLYMILYLVWLAGCTAEIRDKGRSEAVPEFHWQVTDGNEGAKRPAPISLTASDGTGLELVSVEAKVVIEDPLAFTQLYLSFKNPQNRRREGRFEINLPTSAAISRFAMKIGPDWQEGEVVERQAGRVAYEDAMHARRDPALLEKKAGNQFRARVFPIEANQVKQLIVSYSQQLSNTSIPYRLFLAGLPKLKDFEVEVIRSRGVEEGGASSIKGASGSSPWTKLHKEDFTPEGDLDVLISNNPAEIALRDGDLVVMRIKPELDLPAMPIRDLTILFDTSGSRSLGFASRVSRLIDLVSALRDQGNAELPLRVVCFDQEVQEIYQGSASGFVESGKSSIIARSALGASDLHKALRWLQANAMHSDRVILFSDGIVTAGTRNVGEIQAAVAELGRGGVQRLDVVVDGGIQDTGMLEHLVGSGLTHDGSVVSTDSSLASAIHRLTSATRSNLSVAVKGAKWVWPHTLHGVQSGEQYLIFARLEEDKEIRVSLDEGPAKRIAWRRVTGPLLQREWVRAKIEYLNQKRERLGEREAEAKGKLRDKIVELSTKNRVLSDFTSLVVLETEADYRRLGLERKALADILIVGDKGIEVVDGKQQARDRLFEEPWLEEGVASDEKDRGRRRARIGTIGAGPNRFGISGTERNSDPHMARERSGSSAGRRHANEEGRQASTDGVIGILKSSVGSWNSPTSPYGRDTALGNDPMSALGALTGDKIGASFGFGALGIRGTGRGGGGTGSGTIARGNIDTTNPGSGDVGESRVGLTPLNTIGHGAGGGTSSGFGRGSSGGSSRTSGVGSVLTGRAQVFGSLSPEVIRRTISRHINEVKFCYLQELNKRPNLAGRVSIKFMISATGEVRTAVVADSSLNNAPVENCVIAAARRWSFPKPEGGNIVVATYPFIFRQSGVVSESSSSNGSGNAVQPSREQQLRAARQAQRERLRRASVQSEWKQRPQPELGDFLDGKLLEVRKMIADDKSEAALAAALRWRREAPSDVMALIGLGEAAEAVGDPAYAARAYGSLIDMFPSRADIRRMTGQRLERLGKSGIRLAIDTYRRALEQRPDHPSSHRLYAFALLKDDRPDKAFDALKKGYEHQYPFGRFAGVKRILRDDLGILADVWMSTRPDDKKRIQAELRRLGIQPKRTPSLRFVLYWETDANDVDLHVYNGKREHAYYSQKRTWNGGELYADVTDGYGPECFTVEGNIKTKAYPYTVLAHYYSRGSMGYGMGTLQIIAHDGAGHIAFDDRAFIIMKDRAYVPLGTVDRPLL